MIRALSILPVELKPRIRRMSNGWWQLTAPRWDCLRGKSTWYISASSATVLERWAQDVARHHGVRIEALIYRARREWREYKAIELHKGSM